MPVSTSSSQLIYSCLKDVGVRIVSALPETWLVHLIRMAEDDDEMTLVRLAKEEEGVGISAGLRRVRAGRDHSGGRRPTSGTATPSDSPKVVEGQRTSITTTCTCAPKPSIRRRSPKDGLRATK